MDFFPTAVQKLQVHFTSPTHQRAAVRAERCDQLILRSVSIYQQHRKKSDTAAFMSPSLRQHRVPRSTETRLCWRTEVDPPKIKIQFQVWEKAAQWTTR